MTIKNTELWRRFDADQAVEALVGHAEYFIPDVTYRESHDRVLVIGQLLDWAQARDKEELLPVVVLDAIDLAVTREGHRAALETLLSYGVVLRSRHQLTEDAQALLSKTVERLLPSIGGSLAEDGELMAMLEAIQELTR